MHVIVHQSINGMRNQDNNINGTKWQIVKYEFLLHHPPHLTTLTAQQYFIKTIEWGRLPKFANVNSIDWYLHSHISMLKFELC